MNSFTELSLIEPIQRAIAAENYTKPTPIQAQSIPHLLQGRDLFGCAQTGTGKTAAFALPILNRLASDPRPAGPKGVRCLVLTPTRELAAQIGDSFKAYGRHLKLSHTVIFGGVGQNPQINALARGIDIVIATPGRLLDLMNQGHVRLDRIEVFVLDEADRMLDMGFIHDIRKILAVLPKKRQSLFFSATVPPDIAKLADSILVDPVKVEVTPVSSTAERIDQKVLFVEKVNKRHLLAEVLKDPAIERAIVFTRTKHGANRVAEHLSEIDVTAQAIHGNKSQNARTAALESFRAGKTRVLVATDIAARGIDIDGITHVINFDLPNEPESYVHRIGRTGRAGAAGIAISFCDAEERAYLRSIEKVIQRAVPVDEDHPWHSTNTSFTPQAQPQGRRGQPGGRPAGARKPQGAGKTGAAKPQGAKPQGGKPAGQSKPQAPARNSGAKSQGAHHQHRRGG